MKINQYGTQSVNPYQKNYEKQAVQKRGRKAEGQSGNFFSCKRASKCVRCGH